MTIEYLIITHNTSPLDDVQRLLHIQFDASIKAINIRNCNKMCMITLSKIKMCEFGILEISCIVQ